MPEATNYAFVSVPRKDVNAGRPKGKKMYICFFRWEDVQEFARDAKGVRVIGFSLKEGKTMIAVYATPSTINAYDKLEGEADARGYVHYVDFEHPGSDIETSEFLNNNANENLGAIIIGCSGDDVKVAGTPCTPLNFATADGQDNNEGDKTTISLVSSLRGAKLGIMAKSLVPETDNAEINAFLGITAAADSAGEGV